MKDHRAASIPVLCRELKLTLNEIKLLDAAVVRTCDVVASRNSVNHSAKLVAYRIIVRALAVD